MSDRKKALSASFGMAAVWFATHAGSGFATGNQEVNFYVKYGWTTIFLPFLAMVVLGIAFRNGLAISKDSGAHNYKSFADALYHPYEKICTPIFEICFMANILIAVSASIAGAGTLLEDTLGVPYGIGIVCVGLVLLLLTTWGGDLVLRYKAYFLIVTLLILVILGLRLGAPNFSHIITTQDSFGTGFWAAAGSALLYLGFQSFGIIPIISTSRKITTTKECTLFAVFGMLMNGTLLVLVSIMLLGYAPEILTKTLPVYYVTEKIGFPWLKVLYSVILFVALLGTAISFIFTAVARFENAWEGKGVFSKIRARRILISLLTMVICTLGSTFGLTALVQKGYGSLGYVGLVFVVLPELIVGTVKIRKKARERKEKGITEETV